MIKIKKYFFKFFRNHQLKPQKHVYKDIEKWNFAQYMPIVCILIIFSYF